MFRGGIERPQSKGDFSVNTWEGNKEAIWTYQGAPPKERVNEKGLDGIIPVVLQDGRGHCGHSRVWKPEKSRREWNEVRELVKIRSCRSW